MDFKDTKYGNLSGKVYNGDIKAHSGVSSLKGAPEIVEGDFNCSWCKNIKDLKGAPREVETFSCFNCHYLTSLKDSPKVVNGDFHCSWCYSLTSLKGSPKEVKNFNCNDCKNLESLEGAPKKCKKFNCAGCIKLKNLNPLLRCDIKEVEADEHLLEDYKMKKAAIEKHGYDKAKKVFELLEELS